MTKTDPTGSSWRARWAGRKNERRQRAYDTAVEAWRQRREELGRIRAAAVEFGGSTLAQVGLPVQLRDDEVVHSVLPAAELVEARGRHVAGLPAPELSVIPVADPAPGFRLPYGIKATDAGMLVVTDRRVVFAGRRGEREWDYAQMTGLGHHPAVAFTLLHVLGRRGISGLLLPPSVAPGFRFDVTLAFADAIGKRAAVIAQLDELAAVQKDGYPSPPAAATPDQAPLTALVSRGRLAVAAGLAIALLALAGAYRSGAAARPQAGPATGVTTTTGSTAAAARSAAIPATTAATGAPAVAPSVTGVPTTGASGTAPLPATPVTTEPAPDGPPDPRPSRSTASPPPTEVGLCGAPDNPYGYNYCGGSYIHAPASDVCSYFACVDNFWNGKGYLVQCGDGMVGMLGGPSGSCADHSGEKRPVYG